MNRSLRPPKARILAITGALALWLGAIDARAGDTPRERVDARPAEPPASDAPDAADDAARSAGDPVASTPRHEPAPEVPVYFVDDTSRDAIPFRDGTEVPRGYRLDASPRVGLVAAGASVSGALWVTSTIAAIALDQKPAVEGDPNFDDMYWPMFIPVLGPFIAIGTAEASGTGAGILALDGAFQAGGLAMMVIGLAAPKLELVPQKGIYLNAQASAGSAVLSVGGSF